MGRLSVKKFGISKLLPKTAKQSSLPGTVNYIGKKRQAKVDLRLLNYTETDFSESKLKKVSEILQYKDDQSVKWLNITGVHDEKIILDVGEQFNIHPLVLEDIANTTQRPKIEEYDDYLFLIVKVAFFNEESSEVEIEQVSMLLGNNFVISFQEKESSVLEGLRERIRTGKGKIRKLGCDYLLYCILDSIVDNCYSVLERISEEIENMEEKLIVNADKELLSKIYRTKQELIFLRRAVWPMRDVISALHRAEHELINDNTLIYLRDVYDHIIQVAETVETFRDLSTAMLDLYLTTISNKMNEVMKVLTIFAAIFIPLTFIAGVYGMNFRFMPELDWRYAYPVWWAATVILTIGMIFYFKRKKWL